jgi:predicted dehydrogenase
LRAFGRDAYVSLDYQKRTGVVVPRHGNLDAIRDAAARVRRGELQETSQLDFTQMVQVEPLSVEDVDPLRAQAESFVEAVRQGKRPQVTAEEGLAAVELAARIVAAMPPAAL